MPQPEQTLDGVVDADFGGEPRRFRLTVPDLAKLQAETGVGPAVIAGELARAMQVMELGAERDANGVRRFSGLQMLAAGLGDWKVEYITRPIFHGLIRAGTAPNDARRPGARLDRGARLRGPAREPASSPSRIVTGATSGPEDDKVGELEGDATSSTTPAAPPSPTDRSASPSSTARPARSAGAPATSPKRRSWQLLAAIDGWRKANSPPDEDGGQMSDDELAAADRMLDEHEAETED